MESEDFKMKIGDKAQDFNLIATDGRLYSLFSFSKKPVFVMVFTCNHCPYAQAYERRLIELAKEFSETVIFAAINANDAKKFPDDNLENMKIRANEKGFPYPYMHDETQEVAKTYGALVTPHILVFGKDRKLIYQGGIDNNWEKPDNVTKYYLRDALTEASAGKKIKKKTTPVIGCSVKWK